MALMPPVYKGRYRRGQDDIQACPEGVSVCSAHTSGQRMAGWALYGE
jgi:hypothetical protein